MYFIFGLSRVWIQNGSFRFYRGAVGAMLVYDITNSTTFENLEGWLDELQLQDENTVIMLLGNKCDRNDDREVPAKNAEMFAGTFFQP